MIFSNTLLTRLLVGALLLLLAGCAATPEKNTAEKKPVDKSPAVAAENTAPATAAPVVSSSVLPAGPVTPNPYLQTRPKLSEQVEVSFHEATLAMQQKNWARAETVLQQLASTNPTLSGVQLNLGITYRAQGNPAKAAEAFNRAITINPKNVEAYNQLAVLKREAGEFAAAEALYLKALAAWPFYPEGHKNLAILYELYMGKPELALPHYQAYQQLLPAPDKQVDSWVADLQRRLNGGKEAPKSAEKTEAK